MRADRLISLVMLLQTRGRMTAQELAGRLVSAGRREQLYKTAQAIALQYSRYSQARQP